MVQTVANQMKLFTKINGGEDCRCWSGNFDCGDVNAHALGQAWSKSWGGFRNIPSIRGHTWAHLFSMFNSWSVGFLNEDA